MEQPERPEQTGYHLTLSIWHPDCWTLRVTDEANGGLFGHGVYHVADQMKGRFTAYGDTTDAVEDLVTAIEASPLTDSVWRMDHYSFDDQTRDVGNATRSLLVGYDEQESINDALVSNGFIPVKAVWIHDGREYWTVVTQGSRDRIQRRLDAVREEMDADIDVQKIVSDGQRNDGVLKQGPLSDRQRDVFEHAREQGYYNWPREASATELADDFGITKATFLEHLRKAESKLFDSML